MTKNTSDNLILVDLLQSVQQKLSNASSADKDLREVNQELSQFIDAAHDASRPELFRGAELLGRVLELAACWSSEPGDPELVEQLIDFVKQCLPVLSTVIGLSDESKEIDIFIQMANEKWSGYLELLDDQGFQNDGWDLNSDEVEDANDNDKNSISDSQIELLLSAVSNAKPDSTDKMDEIRAQHSTEMLTSHVHLADDVGDEVAKIELAHDRELLEAYLDDALRCLSSMEQAALTLESSPDDQESVQQFCRELHTLKGASATVGLSKLAADLHQLESSLDKVFNDETTRVEVEPLFAAVDRVRDEIGALQPNSTSLSSFEQETSPNTDPDSPPGKAEFATFSSNDDSSIRIRAAKLDRLMDMLAELVVFRNRRESHDSEFNLFNEELARCASRLKFAEEKTMFEFGADAQSRRSDFDPRNGSSTYSEVGKDIAAVSQGLRELQKPVSHDNASISRFIRDFRQELMQLRRIPVSGLFNRLQRAARDAAKSENKQVQIKVVGEQAGLEQEIQERLFESLLHIVRNSVSHGIKSEAERIRNGKNPVGTVTLEAFSSAQLLVIEVRDDGSGVDYEAVRKRAIKKGLLAPNQNATHDELAKMIFQSGFSTREQASEVSGRGVGMDIVAKTITQLYGRIEVDSVAGQGTTIRLLIPLRTGIEHVMVFRSDGQLFALPMQSVTAAKSSYTRIGNITKLSLSSEFFLSETNESGPEDVLLLRQVNDLRNRNSGNKPSNQTAQIALAVDEMVGPEEVVVRGLPNLLKRHPLFCGVTLSGSGETVLILDSEHIREFCQQHHSDDSQDNQCEPASIDTEKSDKKRVLVVDDSLTARKLLVKFLNQQDFTTVEAGDGLDAIERLHSEKFDLVLTDLDMPRLGGLELLSDIQSGRYCNAPVVVTSSRDEVVFRTKALDYGAIEYVTKPVSEQSITQLLENLQLLPETSKG